MMGVMVEQMMVEEQIDPVDCLGETGKKKEVQEGL